MDMLTLAEWSSCCAVCFGRTSAAPIAPRCEAVRGGELLGRLFILIPASRASFSF